MHESSAESVEDHVVLDIEVDRSVDVEMFLLENLIELLSLLHSSGETIENSAILAFRFLKVVLDHTDNDIIGDETTLVHDALRFSAEFSSVTDLTAEHISCSERAQAVFALETRGMSTFTSTGDTNENDSFRFFHSLALEASVEFVDKRLVGDLENIHIS